MAPVVQIIETRQADGSWAQTGLDCTVQPDVALLTAEIVREQVVKLLPPVGVGIAPDNGPTLVNIQTIFWSPTPTDRELGPVTVLGQPVGIHIHFDHATYDYGDGHTDTVTTPGQAWTPGACTTAQCPGYDGHTYTTTAQTTARSTITWTATFTVAARPAQPIPGTIDGPTATHPVTIIEGRTILVR